MSAPSLRPATKADEDAVRSMIFSILNEYELDPAPKTIDKDLYDIEGFYADGFFYVLEDASGDIIGTVAVKPRSDGVAELRKMYLKSAWRGRGQGKRLLKHAIAEAQKLGVARLELETARILEEAIGLYYKFGFVDCERAEGDRRCDMLLALDLTV